MLLSISSSSTSVVHTTPAPTTVQKRFLLRSSSLVLMSLLLLLENGASFQLNAPTAVQTRNILPPTNPPFLPQQQQSSRSRLVPVGKLNSAIENSNDMGESSTTTTTEEEEALWYEIPEDAVIQIRPNAMKRLEELRQQQQQQNSNNSDDKNNWLYLRIGVKSGGCSGMSYVMDFCSPDDVTEDDIVDEYSTAQIACVVDPKSVLYLYGLELNYSNELIGGGFKFFNPNAEESCGCGSSFGI